MSAEIYPPAEAVPAGFLDRVVAASDLQHAARECAVRLAKLDMAAHVATKLRAREQILKDLRAAIVADDAEFRGRG